MSSETSGFTCRHVKRGRGLCAWLIFSWMSLSLVSILCGKEHSHWIIYTLISVWPCRLSLSKIWRLKLVLYKTSVQKNREDMKDWGKWLMYSWETRKWRNEEFLQNKTNNSYRRNKRLSYEHTKDVSEGNRLPWSLFGPQGLDVVGDVLGQQQPQRVTANSFHQLLVDVHWTLVWEVRVGVKSGHVPSGIKRSKVDISICLNSISVKCQII